MFLVTTSLNSTLFVCRHPHTHTPLSLSPPSLLSFNFLPVQSPLPTLLTEASFLWVSSYPLVFLAINFQSACVCSLFSVWVCGVYVCETEREREEGGGGWCWPASQPASSLAGTHFCLKSRGRIVNSNMWPLQLSIVADKPSSLPSPPSATTAGPFHGPDKAASSPRSEKSKLTHNGQEGIVLSAKTLALIIWRERGGKKRGEVCDWLCEEKRKWCPSSMTSVSGPLPPSWKKVLSGDLCPFVFRFPFIPSPAVQTFHMDWNGENVVCFFGSQTFTLWNASRICFLFCFVYLFCLVL